MGWATETMSPPEITFKTLGYWSRRLLIEHVGGNGRCQVVVTRVAVRAARRELIKHGYISVVEGVKGRPRTTAISEYGREVAALILADYAEALVAAGATEYGVAVPAATRAATELAATEN